MKKEILLMSCMIFLIGIVSADTPTFEFNKEFDLKRGCSNNGFFCDSVFVCNITLVYPDGTLLRDNQIMTDAVSYRNITITQPENNQLGFIKAIESCNNGTVGGFESFEVAITADGRAFQPFPNEFAIILGGVVFIIFGLMNQRYVLLQHIGSIIVMVMGVITLYPGYNFINYSNLLGLALGISLIGIGFYFLVEDNFSRSSQTERYDQGYYDD